MVKPLRGLSSPVLVLVQDAVGSMRMADRIKALISSEADLKQFI